MKHVYRSRESHTDGLMYEFAVRIREAILDVQRPPGMTAEEAFLDLERMVPDDALRCQRAAISVLRYIREFVDSHATTKVM